jgi:hypothetical protein
VTAVGARLARLTARLGELDAEIVTTAGEAIHDAIIARLAADTGGDQSLSGIARGKYKLQVQLSPLRNPAGVRLRPRDRQAGMWTLLERGRTGYTVQARPRRKHKAGKVKAANSRTRAMNVDGAWRAGPWKVGGTRGKHTWTTGIDKGQAEATAQVRALFHRVISDA